MKKTLLITCCMALFAIACEQKQSSESQETEVAKKQIMTLDSAANAAAEATQELSESEENLDAILEEL
ncbi:hypothetical protein [Reichenbachiella sp.]